MRDRELDEELWHLTCEIILQRSKFTDFSKVKERIEEFITNIKKQ